MAVIDFQEYKINKAIKDINNCTQEQIEELLALLITNCSKAVPIVKISNKFGIKVYKKDLPSEVGAKLSINKDLEKTHGSRIIVEVNQNLSRKMQRFAVARELSYYLFNVLPNVKVNEVTEVEDIYILNLKNDRYEKIATSILMPEVAFCQQFLIASEDYDWDYMERYLSSFFEVPRKIVNQKVKTLCNE